MRSASECVRRSHRQCLPKLINFPNQYYNFCKSSLFGNVKITVTFKRPFGHRDFSVWNFAELFNESGAKMAWGIDHEIFHNFPAFANVQTVNAPSLCCTITCGQRNRIVTYIRLIMVTGTSAGFLGSIPPCCLRRRKFDYEMVHPEVYLNKYVVSIAPFSTLACPDCSRNIT